MANNTKTAGIVITLPEGFALESHDFTMKGEGIPAATIVYLLINGFSSTMTDAGTTAAAKVANDMVKEENERLEGKGLPLMNTQERNAFLAGEGVTAAKNEAAKAARAKRLDALLEGSMVAGSRGPNGPRKSPMDQWVYTQAVADLTAYARDNGFKLPTDKDQLAALVEGTIDTRRPDYEARWDAQQGARDLAALFVKG